VRNLGDSYLRLTKTYEAKDGHLNEQYSRLDGAPQGAVDLSWSYASLLSAAEARN
jgi:glucoamylase